MKPYLSFERLHFYLQALGGRFLTKFENLRIRDSTTWESHLGCPRADKMPALQKLDAI
jgi:hypothetical protein